MTAVDVVAITIVVCIFVFYIFLPAFIAYKKGRRWARWILPGLLLGPLSIPFIFWSGRTKKVSDKNLQEETENAGTRSEENVLKIPESSSVNIGGFKSDKETGTSNVPMVEVKASFKATRGWSSGDLIFTNTNIQYVLKSGNKQIFNEDFSRVRYVTILFQSVEICFAKKQKFSLRVKKNQIAALKELLDDLKIPQKSFWNSAQDNFEEMDKTERYEHFLEEKLDSTITPNIREISLEQQASFWTKVGFLVFGKSALKKHLVRIRSAENDLEYLKNGRIEFQKFRKLISDSQAVGADSEKTLFEVGSCSLIEVRKGARVTHRESSYSGSSSGGSIGVGRVRVGGSSSSGYSSSTSISYPAPDILQTIDKGQFIFTNKKVSFIGSMFTKTVPFLKIVDYQSSTLQTLIAPATGSKVWICEFPRIEWQWLCECLLGAAMDTDNRTLDVKAKTIYEDVHALVASEFTRMDHEVDLVIEEYTQNLYSREFDLLELEDKYGALKSWHYEKSRISSKINK